MTDALPQLRPELHGARVLLVDDSDIVREISRAVLEEAGLVVAEAADGAAALAWLRLHAAGCHLIFMDVQMPVLDGIAATAALRSELGERAPPVVALTAHASERERQRCREAGMIDHVTKPVDPAHLIAALNRWLIPPARDAAGNTAAPAGAATPAARPLPAPLPGIDAGAGLASTGGNTALLHAMLARFGERYADLETQLRTLTDAGDYPAAHRLAHTVKGAAATLGVTAVAQAAARIEAALAHAAATGAGVAIDWRELAQALQHCLPLLPPMHAAAPAPAAGEPADTTELPPTAVAEYAALRRLLADNCYAARKAFAALRERLDARDARWLAAGAAVDHLDFQGALAQLDARYPAHAREPT